jgi:D-alanyl-D-alanine carboxypeptidase/D-alanyl-D-alanine-endopeptidase (penicillin-binding protein 4)
MLQRLRGMGIHTLGGDLILDRSAFDVTEKNPGAFDGEPMKPYNASPDALLVNFKSVVMTFTPNPAAGVAAVQYDPPLHGVVLPPSVPLTTTLCTDYRASLKADFSDPKRFRFAGSYSSQCGERVWPIAYADPASFTGRAVLGLWESMGGRLVGTLRTIEPRSSSSSSSPSSTPFSSAPSRMLFSVSSQTLGEVMRDMNKFSNNVLAQHLFLSLSLNSRASGIQAGPANFEASSQQLSSWWRARYGPGSALGGASGLEPPVVENGSGLSRIERASALSLARMLQDAYGAPFMPELMASLPMNGVDGTLRKSKASSGVAHLKTGSLNNVVSRAGYVHAQRPGKEGRRYVFIAMVNSSNPDVLAAARPLFDAVTDWAAAQ